MRAQKIVVSQRSQPPRSAKKKVRNKEERTTTRSFHHFVVRIEFKRTDTNGNDQRLRIIVTPRERSTTPHHRNTAVEFDIPTAIMNDIAGRLIDLDDDSYIDEEDNEEDLDDDLDDNLDDERRQSHGRSILGKILT